MEHISGVPKTELVSISSLLKNIENLCIDQEKRDSINKKRKEDWDKFCNSSDLVNNVFNNVHDLSYEHCYNRNDGTEIIADQSIDQGLFRMCVVGGYNTDKDTTNTNNHNDGLSLTQGLPNTNIITGDERLELFRQMLDEFNWERQDNQVDFHEMMIKTALPCIFEKEWDSDYDRILRLFDLDKHCAETFIVCPRRFGKTVAVAMFCAVYMYLIPNASIAIFSTAQRTSGKMMLAIYQFMKELPYFKDAIFITKNSETICIELYGNRRTMWCYPGKVGVSIIYSILVCVCMYIYVCVCVYYKFNIFYYLLNK